MQVYLIRNRVNGKCYVGQTQGSASRRFRQHICASRSERSRGYSMLAAAIAKYGEHSFEMDVLEEAEDVGDMDMAERHWIRTYNCLAPNGYNLESGGHRHKRMSPESRAKLSAATRGRKQSEEHKEKKAAALRDFHARRPADWKATRKRARHRQVYGKKLTWEKVDELRARVLAGERQSALAREFDISRQMVSKIIAGELWSTNSR